MDKDRIDASLQSLTEATGRRSALRSLATAGMAFPAALALIDAAAKDKKQGGQGRKKKNPKTRQGGERKEGVTAQASPGAASRRRPARRHSGGRADRAHRADRAAGRARDPGRHRTGGSAGHRQPCDRPPGSDRAGNVGRGRLR
jgi:hypothetical protein